MSSVRLRGLRDPVEFRKIHNLVESLVSVHSFGLATRSSGDHEATITFKDSRTKDKVLPILQQFLRAERLQLEVDDHFFGITVLACPGASATLEFVLGPPLSIIGVHSYLQETVLSRFMV